MLLKFKARNFKTFMIKMSFYSRSINVVTVKCNSGDYFKNFVGEMLKVNLPLSQERFFLFFLKKKFA